MTHYRQGEKGIGKLVIVQEQGHGDCIQFIRYAPLLKSHFGIKKVILVCRDPIYRLMRTAPGVDQVVTPVTEIGDYDAHCMVLGLMRVVYQTLGKDAMFGDGEKYLDATPFPKLQAMSCRKIGLCWAGNRDHQNDKFRSIDLEYFDPLFQGRGLVVSLMQGKTPSRFEMDSDITDFLSLAQIISSLDVVVTVDTATAHLAGALGKRCFTLLTSTPDWRWGLDGNTTPWYKSMRLFRAKKPLEWAPVIGEVVKAL